MPALPPAAILSPLNYFKHSWDVKSNLDISVKLILTAGKMPALHNAVMRACDGLEGAADGMLLLDPRALAFDPAALQCPSDSEAAAANCLTKAHQSRQKDLFGTRG